ncbi:MAG: hypothetical protein JST58_11085 [Bacteroidetes bacterium]|nr:hypothetical protein [Bacteroidota bacterium]
MKIKILLSAFIALIIFSQKTNAQIDKGTIWLGGQVSFSTNNAQTLNGTSYSSKSNSLILAPAVGIAVKNNLIEGVDVLYQHISYSNNLDTFPSNNSYSNNYGIGFFVRKYASLGKGFYLFGQGRLGTTYLTQNSGQGNANSSSSSKGFNIGLGFYPGIAYQVSKRFQLETGFNNVFVMQYQYTDSKQTNTGSSPYESKSNSFSVGSSLSNLSSFTLGFRYLISKS